MGKNISILGSTGSIGVNALLVSKHLSDEINVQYLSAYKNGKKLIEQALTFRPKAVAVVDLETAKRVQELTEKQISKVREVISSLEINVEGELRSFNAMNIKRLKDVGAYKGIRHRRGLPANGQRTKTNSRTRKGKKRTIGLGKKAI